MFPRDMWVTRLKVFREAPGCFRDDFQAARNGVQSAVVAAEGLIRKTDTEFEGEADMAIYICEHIGRVRRHRWLLLPSVGGCAT